jgi:hypothetical protein
MVAMSGACAMNRIAAFATTLIFMAGCLTSAAAAPRQDPQHQDSQQATQGQSNIDVTLYPILAQVPIFGAKIDIPDLPSLPGASGTTDLSLNGAFLAGVIVESRRWLLDVNGLWAAVSADHPDPLTNVDTHTAFVNVTGGVRIDRGLFATAGIKRVRSDIDVTVTGPRQTLQGSTNPTLWDPLVGAEYRGQLTPRTKYDAAFKAGGFGVGTDIDISLEGAVDWSISRRFVIRAGYSFLYYKLTVEDANIEAVKRPLISKQTLHGPEIGLGIKF